MSDWWDGDRVHVTMLGGVVAKGTRVVIEDTPGPSCIKSEHYFDIDGPNVVRVERAPVELPTGFGARIRATVRGVPDILCVLAAPGEPDPWFSQVAVDCGPDDVDRPTHDDYPLGRQWHRSENLADVVVLDEGETTAVTS